MYAFVKNLGLSRVFHKAGAACLRSFLGHFVGDGQERLDAASTETVRTSSVLKFGAQRRKGREGREESGPRRDNVGGWRKYVVVISVVRRESETLQAVVVLTVVKVVGDSSQRLRGSVTDPRSGSPTRKRARAHGINQKKTTQSTQQYFTNAVTR